MNELQFGDFLICENMCKSANANYANVFVLNNTLTDSNKSETRGCGTVESEMVLLRG